MPSRSRVGERLTEACDEASDRGLFEVGEHDVEMGPARVWRAAGTHPFVVARRSTSEAACIAGDSVRVSGGGRSGVRATNSSMDVPIAAKRRCRRSHGGRSSPSRCRTTESPPRRPPRTMIVVSEGGSSWRRSSGLIGHSPRWRSAARPLLGDDFERDRRVNGAEAASPMTQIHGPKSGARSRPA